MNSLSKAGFNEFQIKYTVGKKIPLSDATYLNLKQQIIEKYPQAYSKYLCITETTTTVKAKDKQIEELRNALIQLEKERAIDRTRIENMQTSLNNVSKDVNALMVDFHTRHNHKKQKSKLVHR